MGAHTTGCGSDLNGSRERLQVVEERPTQTDPQGPGIGGTRHSVERGWVGLMPSSYPISRVRVQLQKSSWPRFRSLGRMRSTGVRRRRCAISSKVSPSASTKRGLRCARAVASPTNGGSGPTVGALRGSGLRGQPETSQPRGGQDNRWADEGLAPDSPELKGASGVRGRHTPY